MKESVTYQGIVEEGSLMELHNGILRQGRKKFGIPSAQMEMAIQKLTDLDRLRRILDELRDRSTWEELLTIE